MPDSKQYLHSELKYFKNAFLLLPTTSLEDQLVYLSKFWELSHGFLSYQLETWDQLQNSVYFDLCPQPGAA